MRKWQSGRPGVPPGQGQSYGVTDGKEEGDRGDAVGRKHSPDMAQCTEEEIGDWYVIDITQVTNR